MENSPKKTPSAYASDLCNSMGTLTFIFLLLYFLIMRAMHLHEVMILSALNIVVLFIGILLTYRMYRQRTHQGIDFSTGIRMGLHVTLLAIIPFSLFICLYLHVDTNFMEFMKTHNPLGDAIDPNIAALLVLGQGAVVGFLLAFLLMQFYKKPWHA
jgi:hypothetical protein